jgi:hypothetical protein
MITRNETEGVIQALVDALDIPVVSLFEHAAGPPDPGPTGQRNRQALEKIIKRS